MAFDGELVTPGTGPTSVAFVPMGDGTKAQAVVPLIGTEPQGPANPAPTTDATAQEKLDTIITALGALLTELGGKTEPANTQAVSAAALPLPTGAATDAKLDALITATGSVPAGGATLLEQQAQDETLYLILCALNTLISRVPMLTNQLAWPVRVESAGNAAINVSQWGGQTAAIGAGGSGNGAPRVTPAADTVAGLPHIHMSIMGMCDQGWANIRDLITT